MMNSKRVACWYLVAVSAQTETVVSGILLKRLNIKRNHESVLSHFLGMLKSFAYKPLANEVVVVKACGETREVKTDGYGFFEATFSASSNTVNTPSVFYKKEEAVFVFEDEYPANFALRPHQTLVISDVDDTAIQSFTASARRRISTILFTKPSKRKSIAFTKQFMGALMEQNAFVCYVSRSEANLFGLITKVLINEDVPLGPIYLAPFVSIKKLLGGVDKSGLKKQHIKRLLLTHTAQTVVLLGDDTQEDLAIYGELAEEFPQRVKHIYIHQTTPLKKESVTTLAQQLVEKGIPVDYFKKTDDGAAAANKLIAQL